MLIENKEGAIFILSSGKVTLQPKTHGNLNDIFHMPKTSLKTIKTNTTFIEKPYPFKTNQPHMPHITKLNLSKENKENIPPFMLCDNLSNLIDYFDSRFKDYESYFTYFANNYPNRSVNPPSSYLMPTTVNTNSCSNRRRITTPSCYTPKEC